MSDEQNDPVTKVSDEQNDPVTKVIVTPKLSAFMPRLTTYTDDLRQEVIQQSKLNIASEEIVRRLASLNGVPSGEVNMAALIVWIGNSLIQARKADGLPAVTMEV